MDLIAAREAKNRFGELLDMAQRHPVVIERHGRPVAVMVSAEDYDQLEVMKLERLKAELRQGLNDLEAGQVVDGEAFLHELIEEGER